MSRIKNFLIRQPIEVYVVLVTSTLWLAGSALFDPVFRASFSENTTRVLAFDMLFGGSFLFLAFIFFYFYIAVKAVPRLMAKVIPYGEAYPRMPWRKFFFSLVFIGIVVGVGSFITAIAASQIAAHSTPERMAEASTLNMQWDYEVFGTYPSFWIQRFSQYRALDAVLLWSYRYISIFMCIVFLGLVLVRKRQVFRTFVIAFFLAPVIAAPIWYALPAITPNEMYRENVLEAAIPPAISSAVDGSQVSAANAEYLNAIREALPQSADNIFLVSNNPSMHIAWGSIITFFAIVLWWPLALIFIPWFIAMTFGTLYTLQHYAVDLPTGFAMGLIAIFLAKALLRLEQKYYRGEYPHFAALEIMQNDAREFWKRVSTPSRSPLSWGRKILSLF